MGNITRTLRIAPLAALMLVPAHGIQAQSAWGPGERIDHPGVLGMGGTRIGVSIRDLDERDLTSSNLPSLAGALVERVGADTPAADAGVLRGDIVVEFDGERIRSASQLTRVVRETPAGRTVTMVVRRDSGRIGLEITPREGTRIQLLDRVRRFGEDFGERLGERLEGLDLVPFGAAPLGIGLQQLHPQLARYFGVDGGVLVASVRPDSPGADAGLQAGDVLRAINGSPVDEIADARRLLSALDPGDDFTLEVVRDGEPLSLAARLGGRRERRVRPA